MPDESKPRRLRAIFKNAVVWGGIWGVLGTAISAVFRLNDSIPFGHAIIDGIGMGIRIGVVGALTGAVFATFISIAYRGRSLREISWAKFGAGAAVLAGVFVPTWMQTLNLLSGDGMVPFSLINGDIVMSALFGGITAAGTMLMAQRAEAKNPVTVEELLDRMEQRAIETGSGGFRDVKMRARQESDR